MGRVLNVVRDCLFVSFFVSLTWFLTYLDLSSFPPLFRTYHVFQEPTYFFACIVCANTQLNPRFRVVYSLLYFLSNITTHDDSLAFYVIARKQLNNAKACHPKSRQILYRMNLLRCLNMPPADCRYEKKKIGLCLDVSSNATSKPRGNTLQPPACCSHSMQFQAGFLILIGFST